MTDDVTVLDESRTETAGEGTGFSTVPTPTDDEHLRGAIRCALTRQNARPVARRTLELLAEASVEPIDGTPGYRVVDRAGQTRLRPVSADQAKKGIPPSTPLTLDDLVEEIRARHPDLFGEKPAPPTPENASRPDDVSVFQAGVAQARTVGTQFLAERSTSARELAARSVERGRALASATGDAIGNWRGRLNARLAARQGPADNSPSTAAGVGAALPASERMSGPADARRAEVKRRDPAGDTGARLSRGFARVGEAARRRAGSRPRQLAWAGVGLAAVALVLTLALIGRGGGDATSRDAATPSRTESSREAMAQTSPPDPATQKPDSTDHSAQAPANPSDDPEEQPDAAPPQAPNEVAGVPDVIDTATLRISGKILPLFGVQWVRGGQADELSKYLARRSVSCQPAPGSRAYRCKVDGRDLSEVVLFNGGGRASSEAGPELVAAEDHARSERLGVWKR